MLWRHSRLGRMRSLRRCARPRQTQRNSIGIASPSAPHAPPQVQDQDGIGATDRTPMFSPKFSPLPVFMNSKPNPPKLWKCPLPEYDFKNCSCPPCNRDKTPNGTAADLPFPRVRKEWREMNDTEIDRYACALNVMSTVSTEAGRKCYGRTYVYFADIVMKHACVASDPRGDQGHRGPEFTLFHKSTLLTYEGSILAIDPKIGANPYWNMPLDSAPVLNVDGTVNVSAGKYYCPAPSNGLFGSKYDDPKKANPGCDPKKYIWSDAYFGEQLGSGPNFEVTNGRWRYWTMARWGDFDTTYWSRDDKSKVNNECIINRYFTPQSATPTHSSTTSVATGRQGRELRKNPTFYGKTKLTHDQLNQNCVRCCDALHKDGIDVNCKCQPDELDDIYMRGPTLDTQTCSPYVTRNPNGRSRGFGTAGPNGNGRSQQDSLIRYTQDDFDACANSDNTRNWIEWENCQEGVYCPAEKETCKQSELKKVYALHSTAHDKTLGEIGDVTTSPADPALFYSYHAYIDKNFMAWQESMMDTGRMTDPVKKDLGQHDQSDPPDLTNKNYFGYPRQATHEEWLANKKHFDLQPGEYLPGFTYNLTQGARTYSTSGPFIYMTPQDHPKDFFSRGDQADPTRPWIPGTLLQDIANGGIPFRDIFPSYDGGRFGYSNKEIMEWSMPCRNGRKVNDTDKPCSSYSYSTGE